MWQCRSPRRSSTVDQVRPRRRRARRLELAAALAQLGRDPRRSRASRRPPLRSRSGASRRSRRRGSRTGTRAARAGPPPRAAGTLCALEPVKCCSTLPNWSGSTTCRSTFMPVWVSHVRRVVARRAADSMIELGQRGGERRRVGAVAMMSMSLTESVQPASRAGDLDRSAAGCAAARSRSARDARARGRAGRAAPARRRRASASTCRGSPRPCSPKPRSARMWPASAAARSASSESMPSSSYSRRARLGPKPGRCITGIRPAGNFARSLTAAGMSPVSSSARSFSSSVLPMSGSSVTLALAGELGDGHGRVAHRARRVAVGDDAVLDRAVELVEVPQLLEGGGDLGVGQVGHGRH